MRRRLALVLISLLAGIAPAHAVDPKVSVGGEHVLLLRSDGSVWAWGRNQFGQLGLGGGSSRNVPVQIPGLSGVIDVVARGSYSMALKADGTVWAWGDDSNGRVGPAVSGRSDVPVQVIGLSTITGITAGTGASASLAYDKSGSVFAWGDNNNALLGTGQSSSGTNRQPRQLSGVSRVVSLSASNAAALALQDDGTVIGWGYTPGGTLIPGLVGSTHTAPRPVPGLSSVRAVAATSINLEGQHYAIRDDGSVVSWGQNSTSSTNCGQRFGGGSVLAIGPITGLSNIAQIAPGDGHTLFIAGDGRLFACGNNGSGQLGDGTRIDPSSSQPKIATVAGLPPVVSAGAGNGASGAIGNDGSVWSWGQTSDGRSGAGTDGSSTTPNLTPVRVLTAPGGAPFDAGQGSNSPPVFAGTQSGFLDNATVDVGVAVAPAHRGQEGSIYVAVPSGEGYYFLTPSGFVPHSGGPLPAYSQGSLPRHLPLNIVTNTDLRSYAGLVFIVGYGVGRGSAAEGEMLQSQRYSAVLTLR